MDVIKVVKDRIRKALSGNSIPREVLELKRYFALYDGIDFRTEKQEDGSIVAVSVNFNRGSIVTSAASEDELDRNIQDAILTVFGVPSAYAKEAGIHKRGSSALRYAAA
jgi:hypothetical protein